MDYSNKEIVEMIIKVDELKQKLENIEKKLGE